MTGRAGLRGSVDRAARNERGAPSADGPVALFHAARELEPGRWFYTCFVGSQLRSLGYCSTNCRHTAKAEAERHYEQFLVDTAALDGRWVGKEYRCEACGTWTDRYAFLHSNIDHRLCTRHLNRATLATLISLAQG
jgi:hypothetical protein